MGELGNRRPVPWQVNDVVLASALVIALFSIVLIPLALLAKPTSPEEDTLLAPWVIGLLELLMVAAVWQFAIRKYRTGWHSLGLRHPEGSRSFLPALLALVGSLTFAGAYAAIVTALGTDLLRPPTLPADIMGEGLFRLLNSLVIVVWGPFAEEIFFRGFLLAALAPALGDMRAAVVSSAVFAAAHLSLGLTVPIFVTGLLLAWLYLKTRSLWPPIVMHAGQNLIAVSAAA